MNNLALSTNNIYKTHFIYLNKKDINSIDDVKKITRIDININNTIIINNSNINNINSNNIGKILLSDGNNKCDLCQEYIKIKSKYKILKCNHMFHIKCINNKLHNDIYKKCTKCNIENITDLYK